MIIDFHTHVFPGEIIENRERYVARDTWFAECYGSPKSKAVDADALVASMDRAGIDRSVVCGFCWADAGLAAYHNDYIIDAVSRHPDRLIGLAMVRPDTGAAAVAELERCVAAGLRGAGEINPDAQQFDLADFARLEPFVAALTGLRALMLLHCSEPVGHLYPGKGRTNPELVYQFIARFPDVKLVCAHWGGGLPFYELMPEVAEAARNVYYDTSASSLLYRPDVFRVVPQIVGPHKVLFGTDYPLLRQDRFLATVRGLGLPSDLQDDILGANAARLLNDG